MMNDSIMEDKEEMMQRIKELEESIEKVSDEVKGLYQKHIKLHTSFKIVKLV